MAFPELGPMVLCRRCGVQMCWETSHGWIVMHLPSLIQLQCAPHTPYTSEEMAEEIAAWLDA